MTYEEVREKAKDGDILFLRVNRLDFLSKFTSWFTGSDFTHACFVFWFKERLMVVESTTHGGIRLVNASIYANRSMELLPKVKDWKEIESIALDKIGTAEYGWTSSVYIGLREYIFLTFGYKLPQNDNNRNKACSEFVAEILNFEEHDVTPRYLFEVLSNRI